MGRDVEKDLIEIKCAIKSQEEKDNVFTMSVLQRCYKLVSQLKEYETLEEQGKLLKLPCAVGDTVYRIVPKIYRKIAELKIKEFVVCENGLCFRTNKTNFNYSCDEFGEYIFLTKEAAEAALKEMSE